jgi:hypothetical protein
MRHVWPIAVVLLIVACESSTPSADRREGYLDTHPETSPAVRRAILEGEIVLGMSYAEVVASLGRFDSAGPDVGDLGDYHVRLYGPRALTFHGAELEDGVLVFTSSWGDDPMFRRLRERIRAHAARTRD